jgi:hypothetical protein
MNATTTTQTNRTAPNEAAPKKILNPFQIPFPKTLTDLAALDATREVPFLKAICNRRGIHIPGPNPTPAQIIPTIECRLADHLARPCQSLNPHSGDYVEWHLIHDDLAEFLQNLRHLAAQTPAVAQSRSIGTAVSQTAGLPALPNPKTQSAICDLHSKIEKTSGHSNNSNPQRPKTPAIQTNPPQPPKTPGHSNNPPQKNSPSLPPTQHPQSAIPHPQSTIPNPPSPRPRRNRPILATLTDAQKQQLIDLYQQHSAAEAVRLAREQLGIQISVGTLSNLYTTWQIAEDQTTREDLEATHNDTIENLTQKQLQLRLLELASRPNMDTGELRAICHSFARLESLKLSQRRVQLAEAKEARVAQKDKPKGGFSPEKCRHGVRVLFGKATPEEQAEFLKSQNPHSEIPNPQSNIPNPQSAIQASGHLQNHPSSIHINSQ